MQLSEAEVVVLCGLIFAAAILYSSVGQAGASGYLAAMALFGLAPESMKPAALTLNILVAAIATEAQRNFLEAHRRISPRPPCAPPRRWHWPPTRWLPAARPRP
jgi:hypothetical protein